MVLGSHQRRSSSKAYWHHIRCGFAVLYMLTNCWLMLSRPHALDPWPISMILLWHSFSIETATTCPSTSVLVAFFIPYWAVKLNACHADSWHRLTVGAPWTGNARVVGVMAPTPWAKSKWTSFVSMRRGPKPCKSSICRPWINWLTVLLMVMSNIIDSCLSIRRIHARSPQRFFPFRLSKGVPENLEAVASVRTHGGEGADETDRQTFPQCSEDKMCWPSGWWGEEKTATGTWCFVFFNWWNCFYNLYCPKNLRG